MKEPIIILTGPTAVGKTALSINLAKKTNAEIISADSMQVYKHMDIGTAKIMPQEMQGIKHHMIDIFEPDYPFNVAEFKNIAKKTAKEIVQKGKLPLVCGGTGFYIQALLNDISFDEEINDGYRKSLEDIATEESGADILYKMLQEIDPESAKIIHKNNIKRVIRALEYYHLNNEPISKHNEIEKEKESPYNFAYFVLTMNREKLYERIDKRIDIMINDGLVCEVENLVKNGLNKNHISMQGLGYKEIYDYLKGDITLDEAVYILKRDTRHFAKRQLTWFRREKNVIWIDKDNYKSEDEILEFMLNIIYEKGIIK